MMPHSEPVPTPPTEAVSYQYKINREKMSWVGVKKYILHGFVFSLLMFAILIGWIFILGFLVVIGSVIGLIIGVVALVYVIGWLNVNLTRYFWHIEADSKWTALIAHGFVLLLALLLVSIPQLLVSMLIPSLITTILMFIIYCFVDGYVAKNLAEKVF